MAELSDEARLIRVLQLHKALKLWTIEILLQQGIPCQETYGNDEKGDIIVINPGDIPRVQKLLDEMQSQFNPDRRVIDRPVMTADNPHVDAF